ncbi:MAG: hypothetical protein V4808_02705 [Pseudomonadota bacterium]
MILAPVLAWGVLAQGAIEHKEQLRSAIGDAGWAIHGMSHNLCGVGEREAEERRLWARFLAADERYRAAFGEDSGAGIIMETFHYSCGKRDRWHEAAEAGRAALRKIKQLEGR